MWLLFQNAILTKGNMFRSGLVILNVTFVNKMKMLNTCSSHVRWLRWFGVLLGDVSEQIADLLICGNSLVGCIVFFLIYSSFMLPSPLLFAGRFGNRVIEPALKKKGYQIPWWSDIWYVCKLASLGRLKQRWVQGDAGKKELINCCRRRFGWRVKHMLRRVSVVRMKMSRCYLEVDSNEATSVWCPDSDLHFLWSVISSYSVFTSFRTLSLLRLVRAMRSSVW